MQHEPNDGEPHLEGEHILASKLLPPELVQRVAVDTDGGRIHVEWDPQAPVTPLGQLVFFAQFLATGGIFADWVRECPLRYESPNVSAVESKCTTLGRIKVHQARGPVVR